MALSGDGAIVAHGELEGWIDLGDAVNGKHLHRLRSRSVQGRRSNWRVEHLAFSPDGSRIAASYGGLVGLWDVRRGSLIWESRVDHDYPQPLAFSPDGAHIAAGRSGVRLLDGATGKVSATSALHADTLAFSRSGADLIAAKARTIAVAPVARLDAVHSCVVPDVPDCSSVSDTLSVHARRDGQRLLAAHLAGGLYEIDLATLDVLWHLRWPAAEPFDIADVALGEHVAVICGEDVYRLEGELFRQTEGAKPRSCAISDDGGTLAIARSDGVSFTEILDAATHAPRHDFRRVAGDMAWIERADRTGLLVAEPSRLSIRDPATGGDLASWPVPRGWVLHIDPHGGRLVLRGPGERDSLRTLDGALLAELDGFRIHRLSPDAWNCPGTRAGKRSPVALDVPRGT